MTLEELRHEYETDLVGPGIYTRVTDLVERMLRTRDPAIYAGGVHDFRDALPDVTHDFVIDVLIKERQIDYVMSIAGDLGSFDRLVNRQLRRYLARTRVRTVIDNLMDRSMEILRETPFITHGQGEGERFTLGSLTEGPPGQKEMWRAIVLAQGVRKTPASAHKRAPRIFDTDSLTAVLSIFLAEATCLVSRRDLHDFFEYLLTPWLPTFLEEDAGERPGPMLAPDEEAVVKEVAEQLVEGMSTEDRLIFQFKFANVADKELASVLGMSRQSTAPRKKALYERISDKVSGLDPHLQHAVLAETNLMIALKGVDVG